MEGSNGQYDVEAVLIIKPYAYTADNVARGSICSQGSVIVNARVELTCFCDAGTQPSKDSKQITTLKLLVDI